MQLAAPLEVLSALGMKGLPASTTGDRLAKMRFNHAPTRSEATAESAGPPGAGVRVGHAAGGAVAVLDVLRASLERLPGAAPAESGPVAAARRRASHEALKP